MMWRWLSRKPHPDEQEAQRALLEAMRERARLPALGEQVDEVLEKRHRLIRENHFGPQIAQALGVPDKGKDRRGHRWR